jgi:chromosomal replication initiation ATPase DnaA
MKEQLYTDILAKFKTLLPNELEIIKTVLKETLLNYDTPLSVHIQSIEDLYYHFEKCFGEAISIKKRDREIVVIRQYFWYMCKKLFGARYSLKEIGRFKQSNPYNYTSIIHAISKISDLEYTKDNLFMAMKNNWDNYCKYTF